MNTKRYGVALALVTAGALLLSACGSDNNADPGAAGQQTIKPECGGKKDLTGEGSSAQTNAIGEFKLEYGNQCPGQNLAYQPSGSGKGVTNFNGGLVDFAGSDSALKSGEEVTKATSRCEGNAPWHLPLVFGPVAVAYNLGASSPSITLNAETIAKVFNGGIKKWNDEAIKKLNPSASLPDKDIIVYYRSDPSGTTENFQKYLATAAPTTWTQATTKDFAGKVGEGKDKSQGVANAVKATEGSITYVEASFADSAKLSKAKIDNGAGAVELTNATAGAAISQAKISGQGNDLIVDLKSIYSSKAKDAYPLVLVTYEIVCSKGYPAETAKAVKAFLTVAAGAGQDQLAKVGYVPLPNEFRTKVNEAIKAIA
ncbi:phosphate ABC transporter substrate-binding protein PstS [Pseudonocardiaceae bacterium YIM PH 21723]|nr:phosphate ABC transporter substrate-binding protein PstS [Pseudonocardiaceae bacterium YIM PH 21723]